MFACKFCPASMRAEEVHESTLCRRFALRNAGPRVLATLRFLFSLASPRGRRLQHFLFLALTSAAFGQATPPQNDPASEPAVLAVAKVLPAVVNINTERVVRRQVRDPFDDFAAQFFGVYRNQIGRAHV